MENVELFTCLVGSHNYNLNVEESDYDYSTFMLPNFDDLYFGKQVSIKPNITEDQDNTYYDIRKLGQLLWKSNINYIEVLFSEHIKLNLDLPYWTKPYLDKLFNMKEDIARMNLKRLYDSCLGTKYTKMKMLNKGSESSKYLVEKYGYDTKAAMTAYRNLDFLIRYADNGFTDFKKAIWYRDNEEVREFLLKIRDGHFKKDDIVNLIEEKEIFVKERYEALYTKEPNEKTLEELNNTLKKIILMDIKLSKKLANCRRRIVK